MRLILLCDRPDWVALLREQLHDLPALEWRSALALSEARALCASASDAVLLTTPDLLPPAEQLGVPVVFLLEEEPPTVPAGGVDWLVPASLTPDVLRRCLRYVRERRDQQRTLEQVTEQDSLTGIANRHGFLTLLAARLNETGGVGQVLGHLNLDNFHHVNDSLGYQRGDRLIIQVAARLRDQLEPGDLLARLGGDEFALLLDTRRDPRRAGKVALRIVDALSEPYRVEGESLLLGCSLGLAGSQPELEADPLMWRAHIAMRHAKTLDGCTFHVYDEWINRSERGLADLEAELRRALRRDELELHYQPRLCLKTGQVLGLEALVRWRHAERGLLGPGEFIPLAEDTGLIVPLGYWVIARALHDWQWLAARHVPPLQMAVNLSFRQFQDSKLLPTLRRLIAEHGVDPRWLEFELTETAVMRRTDQVLTTMRALERLGVRFSLDDFGTGYSSFVHLDGLPITLLKIDRSFVGGLEARMENRKLVRAMIDLGHNLDLGVVAEGVETAEQLRLLRQFGCDEAQGYFISRPLPLAELLRYLLFDSRRSLFESQ